jgi:hypothetical protein
VLIRHLPVTYFNNLTAVFQKSPIIANSLFKVNNRKKVNHKSYYGKTLFFSGPNDGLHIWDQWFGNERTKIKSHFFDEEKNNIIKFFGAYVNNFDKPLINKNNNLYVHANLIAELFEKAYFLCLSRDPCYLAQSLLLARIDIHGTPSVPYGIYDRIRFADNNIAEDFLFDVCKQVLFYEQTAKYQQRMVGSDRFWLVSYEEFCEQPDKLVARAFEEILGQKINGEHIGKNIKPFESANTIKMSCRGITIGEIRLGRIRKP